MSATESHSARIATAVVLAALAILSASPSAVANEPETPNDGTVTVGPCAGVDPNTKPPQVMVDPDDCVPPSP